MECASDAPASSKVGESCPPGYTLNPRNPKAKQKRSPVWDWFLFKIEGSTADQGDQPGQEGTSSVTVGNLRCAEQSVISWKLIINRVSFQLET